MFYYKTSFIFFPLRRRGLKMSTVPFSSVGYHPWISHPQKIDGYFRRKGSHSCVYCEGEPKPRFILSLILWLPRGTSALKHTRECRLLQEACSDFVPCLLFKLYTIMDSLLEQCSMGDTTIYILEDFDEAMSLVLLQSQFEVQRVFFLLLLGWSVTFTDIS